MVKLPSFVYTGTLLLPFSLNFIVPPMVADLFVNNETESETSVEVFVEWEAVEFNVVSVTSNHMHPITSLVFLQCCHYLSYESYYMPPGLIYYN